MVPGEDSLAGDGSGCGGNRLRLVGRVRCCWWMRGYVGVSVGETYRISMRHL
jgi:hypothetical protein